MIRNNKKKLGLLITSILLAVFVPSAVYGYNYYQYNKFINSGDALLNNDNFDDAIKSYNDASKYMKKKSNQVNEKINLSNNLKTSKSNYEEGIKLASEKKYIESSEVLAKVLKEDDKRYSSAQEKIKENKDSFISTNLSLAKEEAKNSKHAEAISYLDKIIKFDSSNKEVQGLKEEYNKNIQANNEAAAKKEEQKKMDSSISQNQAKQQVSNTSYPIARKVTRGIEIIERKEEENDNLAGPTIIASVYAHSGYIYFRVTSERTTSTISYKAIFHLKEKEVVYTDIASNDLKFITPDPEDIPKRVSTPVDFEINYKGKIYKFTESFIYKSF
jgi:tetratricopeptide (TPR) repeat protein